VPFYAFSKLAPVGKLYEGADIMEYIKTVAIDEMGRIVLPRTLRKENDWQMGTELDVYDAGNGIIAIKLSENDDEE